MLEEYDVHVKLRGEDLPIKDSWIQGGKADPYVVLRKGHGLVPSRKSKGSSALTMREFQAPEPGEYMGEENQATWVYNGKEQFQKNNLNPKWPIIIVPLIKLCDGCEITKNIVIDIWDYDFECPDDFMGFCMLSIFDLFICFLENRAIPLQPGKKGHKWGGRLFVDSIELDPQSRDSDSSDPITAITLLHHMAAKGDSERLLRLIGLQIVPNPVFACTAWSRATPLHCAALGSAEQEGRNSEVVRILLDAKADVFAKNRGTHIPLSLLAKASDDVEIAELLMKKMTETNLEHPVSTTSAQLRPFRRRADI
jgi:hypothetical protein